MQSSTAIYSERKLFMANTKKTIKHFIHSEFVFAFSKKEYTKVSTETIHKQCVKGVQNGKKTYLTSGNNRALLLYTSFAESVTTSLLLKD